MANQKHVLIVEDEKPLLHALELKLSHEGFAVTTAQNGQEGLDQLEKGHFDIVLLDLMMPVVDGFQVLERLRTKGSMPYVIVLSNLSQREDEQRVLSLGAKKYFIKSDTPLATIVEEVQKA
jgi:DNA-binding response OmpR family regulator